MLPLRQAIKFPIIFYRVDNINWSGEVIIDSSNIHPGMIRIGVDFLNNVWNTSKTVLDIRGRLVLHEGIKIGPGSFIRVNKNALCSIGRNVMSSSGLNLYSYYKTVIGDGTKIGWNSIIMDTDSHPLYDEIGKTFTKIYAPVSIGEGCWIGTNCIVLKGTKLANKTTVKAGSVVSGSYKNEKTIIGGNPAIEIDNGYYITEDSFLSYPSIKNKAY